MHVGVEQAVLGEPVDQDPITLVPAVLERYVGVYEINAEEDRVVTHEDGQIYTQRTGGARSEAFAASETEFFYGHSLSRFHFELDGDGRVAGMVMQPWGGGAERARRTDKPVLLLANKSDNDARREAATEFYNLALGDPIPVSMNPSSLRGGYVLGTATTPVR